MESNKYCTNCGTAIAGKFCANCGSSASSKSTKQNRQVDDSDMNGNARRGASWISLTVSIVLALGVIVGAGVAFWQNQIGLTASVAIKSYGKEFAESSKVARDAKENMALFQSAANDCSWDYSCSYSTQLEEQQLADDWSSKAAAADQKSSNFLSKLKDAKAALSQSELIRNVAAGFSVVCVAGLGVLLVLRRKRKV